jgi:hypothetical protein
MLRNRSRQPGPDEIQPVKDGEEMKLNVQKLDERIARLQELRRIATDPEMTAILSEFIVADETKPEVQLAAAAAASAGSSPAPAVEAPEAARVADDADANQNGRSLWGINRR